MKLYTFLPVLLMCGVMQALQTPSWWASSKKNKQLMSVTFELGQSAEAALSAQDEQSISQALEIMQFYGQAQKVRKLTIEEMIAVLQIISVLYLDNSLPYSKQIKVTLPSGDSLTLPLSSELFAALTDLQAQDNQSALPDESLANQ